MKPEPSVNDNMRSIDDAIKIASIYGKTLSLTRTSPLVVDYNAITPIFDNNSRSCSEPLIYAVNYTDNNGYLLISACKSTEPVLAIIENGNYLTNQSFEYNGYENFIDYAKSYVRAHKKSLIYEPNDSRSGYIGEDFLMVYYSDTISTASKSQPRVDVEWGQDWPENIYCPNKIVGCAPVAIAQLMSYLKPKLSIDLTYNERPYSHLNVDWNNISKHKKSTTVKNPPQSDIELHLNHCNATSDVHVQLAAFLRKLGVECNSTYYDDSTGTEPDSVNSCIKKLLAKETGITSTKIFETGFYDNLKIDGVALVSGMSMNPFAGHQWLMDGVGTITYHITKYYNYNPKTRKYTRKETAEQVSKYIHINWGWSGECNGYYLENVYDTNKVEYLDLYPPTSTRYNFNVGIIGEVYRRTK